MTLKIDGRRLEDMSIDQIAASLRIIASELNARANAPDAKLLSTLVWAFDRLDETALELRRSFARVSQ